MGENVNRKDLIEEWREGRLKGSEGILTFIVMAVSAVVSGVTILVTSPFTGLGISLTVIGLLILGWGVAAKA